MVRAYFSKNEHAAQIIHERMEEIQALYNDPRLEKQLTIPEILAFCEYDPQLEALYRSLLEGEDVTKQYGLHGGSSPVFAPRILLDVPLPQRRSDETTREGTIRAREQISVYSPYGLPYGAYSRLLLYYITTAVKRNFARQVPDPCRVDLGDSFLTLLRKSLIIPKGDRPSRVQYERAGEQLRRFVGLTYYTRMAMYQKHKSKQGVVKKITRHDVYENMVAAEYVEMDWVIYSDGRPWDGESEVENAYIKLSAPMALHMEKHCIPLNPHHVALLGTSPMALDLYQWAAYRSYTRRERDLKVSWVALKQQFGCGYADTSRGVADFKKQMKKHLGRIEEVYQGFNFDMQRQALVLKGPRSPVLHKAQRQQYFC